MVTGNATATRSAGVAATRKGGGSGGDKGDDDDRDTDKWGCLYLVVGLILLAFTLITFYLYNNRA